MVWPTLKAIWRPSYDYWNGAPKTRKSFDHYEAFLRREAGSPLCLYLVSAFLTLLCHMCMREGNI